MMIILRTLPIALLLLVLGACSSSRTAVISAYTDPDFVGRAYGRIVVQADTADLHWRTLIERHVAEGLREEGIDAIESARMLSPTRSWTAEQRAAELARRGVDAVLAITLKGMRDYSHHVPQTTTTTVERDEKAEETKSTDSSQKEKREKETITTTTQGGYQVTRTWATYEVSLIDVSSARVAWIGGSFFALDNDGLALLRDQLVEQLRIDRMLAGAAR